MATTAVEKRYSFVEARQGRVYKSIKLFEMKDKSIADYSEFANTMISVLKEIRSNEECQYFELVGYYSNEPITLNSTDLKLEKDGLYLLVMNLIKAVLGETYRDRLIKEAGILNQFVMLKEEVGGIGGSVKEAGSVMEVITISYAIDEITGEAMHIYILFDGRDTFICNRNMFTAMNDLLI